MASESGTRSVIDCQSFCFLLTLLFFGLKLTNQIDWSWWWVWSPLWLPVATVLGVMAVVCLAVLLLGAVVLVGEKVTG